MNVTRWRNESLNETKKRYKRKKEKELRRWNTFRGTELELDLRRKVVYSPSHPAPSPCQISVCTTCCLLHHGYLSTFSRVKSIITSCRLCYVFLFFFYIIIFTQVSSCFCAALYSRSACMCIEFCTFHNRKVRQMKFLGSTVVNEHIVLFVCKLLG